MRAYKEKIKQGALMKICLNCQNRYLGCHSECKEYKKEKEKNEQAKVRKNEYLDNYSVMFNLSLNRR